MSKFLEPKNPIFKENTFNIETLDAVQYEKMTVSGAINKSFILLGILLLVSSISYMMPSMFLTIVGLVGGLIAVLVGTFKPHTSPIAAPVYAAFEGLLIGSISAYYATAYNGIVGTAILLTISTLFIMLAIYKFEIIKVTQKLRAGIVMATGAVMITYLMAWIFSWFGMNIPYIHEGGLLGIGFSVVVIGIAALNLLLDFDTFDKGEKANAPSYMEWYAAMGLLVTLVWLYIEFLRLLAKLNDD